MMLAEQSTAANADFWSAHSGEIMILVLFALVVLSLLILVPQLLRAHMRKAEMVHDEHLKALEHGLVIQPPDEPAKAAGRTAMLVPMVVIISAATVTCFLAAYKNEQVFAVGLTVWAVAGVVSLAAITGGVALLGRLAQIEAGLEEVEEDKPPQNSLKDH
jgi:hypothetical protein